MRIELLGGTSKEELERRIRMVAAAGKLSQFPGNVFEVLDDSCDYAENLKVIKRITKMGHKSITEHDYLVFAISDVTPIVEQTIIGNRLTSFTIKSRRYVDFRSAGFYVPNFRNEELSLHMENETLKDKYKAHMEYLFKEYSDMIDNGIPNEDARFLLPYSFYSNIVMGLDARELEKMILYLLHGEVSKIQELRKLGEELLKLANEYVPYLKKSIEKYKKHETVFDYKKVIREHNPVSEILDKPVLLEYTASPDDLVLQLAIMYEVQCSYDEALRIISEAEKTDPEFRQKFMNEILSKDENRELEEVSFTFQIPISLAVLTHLTRHRMHSLLVPNFVPLWNFRDYIIPYTIKNAGFEDKYKEIIEANIRVLQDFKNVGVIEEDLVYFYLGCQMCNVVTTVNARSLMWISRMRCCQRAQWQIREIANHMTLEAKKVAPLISKGFGPTCIVNHVCNEGPKSCGLINKILENKG